MSAIRSVGFYSPEIAAADAGAADGDECIGRLDQAGVGQVLDANVLGAVLDARAHLELLRASGGRASRERATWTVGGRRRSAP